MVTTSLQSEAELLHVCLREAFVCYGTSRAASRDCTLYPLGMYLAILANQSIPHAFAAAVYEPLGTSTA